MQDHYNRPDAFICTEGKNKLCNFDTDIPLSVKIVLLFGGEIKVWVENKSAEVASKGDVIIVFPSQRYRFETQRAEEYITVTADIRRLNELLNVFSSSTPANSVIKGAANDNEICTLAKNAVRAYAENKSEYRDATLKGYVIALLGKLFSMSELKKNEIAKSDTLSEIVSYCNLHFKEKLSLEILEHELHISKYYISHVINEKLGEGFNEYINSIRINEACKLLVKSDKSIKEISAEVGFGTVRSFDRAFKAKNGETAREYRQRNA